MSAENNIAGSAAFLIKCEANGIYCTSEVIALINADLIKNAVIFRKKQPNNPCGSHCLQVPASSSVDGSVMTSKPCEIQHVQSEDLVSPPAKVQCLDSNISFSPSNMSVYCSSHVHILVDHHFSRLLMNQ